MQNSQQMSAQPQAAQPVIQQPGAQMAPVAQQQAQGTNKAQQGSVQFKDWAAI